MKFGKRYLEQLSAPGIPPEWRQTAIEYRKLKKVINRVASELEEMGLSSEVLKAMLQQGVTAESSGGKVDELSSTDGTVPDRSARSASTSSETKPELHEDAPLPKFAWDSSEEECLGGAPLSPNGKGERRKSSRRRPTASYELAGTSEHPEPRIRLVFESASSDSLSEEDSSPNQSHSLFPQNSSDTEDSSDKSQAHRFTEIDSSDEGSVDAEKDKDDVDDSESSDSVVLPSGGDFEGAGPKEKTLLKKMYGLEIGLEELEQVGQNFMQERRRNSDETVRREVQMPLKATEDVPNVNEPVQPSKSKRPAAAPETDDADDERASSTSPPLRKHRHRRHRKEVFIPLKGDSEFLTLLATALASLAALQTAQKQQFANAVQLLAKDVSNVASPSRSKNDLYVWREIFSLWVEAQIFESERERDRGERTVEEAEKRLDWFVAQVAQRTLAKKMRNKESKEALERFIKLNVQLLDLKRFQLANEEAARKILKKHDKRTALTASQGFPEFIAAASSLTTTGPDANDATRRVLMLPGMASLPHILLSTLTTTLLPIIPQLDDYICGICGDVAFKPIKLDCSHKFCVRCLVKMQKRGQDACPHCRKRVVLRANAKNLDLAMAQYLQLWFPKEVKLKDNLNRLEAGREELEAMGLHEHKCHLQ